MMVQLHTPVSKQGAASLRLPAAVAAAASAISLLRYEQHDQ
jgi:hypothetical protein